MCDRLDCSARFVVPDILTYHLAAAVLLSNAIVSPFLLLKLLSEVLSAVAHCLSVSVVYMLLKCQITLTNTDLFCLTFCLLLFSMYQVYEGHWFSNYLQGSTVVMVNELTSVVAPRHIYVEL